MVPDPALFVAFLAAAAVLLVTPGPSVVYVTTRTVDQGLRRGVVSVLGLGVGDLLLVTAAAIGLARLVATSALAFTALRYLGAAYLVWLGMQRLRAPSVSPDEDGRPEQTSAGRVFLQGVLVNALNPKSAIFFLAFLPPFIDPSRGSVAGQTMLLGLAFVALGIVTNSGYAFAATAVRGWLVRRPAFARVQKHVTGWTYIALGGFVLATGARRD